MSNDFLIEMENITKKFPGVIALENVNFSLKAGEIHVIVGQNGAGKSTLVNILAGTIQEDQGIIKVRNQNVKFSCPADAQQAGIILVPQEIPIFPELSIAENLFMGVLPIINKAKLLKLVDYSYIYQEAEKILVKLGVRIDAREKAGTLPVATQQLLVVGKALLRNARILIMDEPTASLGNHEIDILFKILEELCQNEKVGIVYICHRLDEARRVGHRITILRDGHRIDTVEAKCVTSEALFELMTGRKSQSICFQKAKIQDDIVIKVEDLSYKSIINNVSFSVGKGEIVGIAGVIGSGRSELLKVIFGIYPKDSGRLQIYGKDYDPKCPRNAIDNYIGYLPADRNNEGLHLIQSIAFNTSLAILSELTSKLGIVSTKREQRKVSPVINRLEVKTSSLKTDVWALSGGNRQKVAIAKWISAGSKIILCDEPTRGVDVSAKVQMYKLIKEMAHEGVSFIISSPDVEELITICDRIIIMNRGKAIADLLTKNTSEQSILDIILSQS